MGGWIVDFGRNVTGWAGIDPPAPTDDKLFCVSDDSQILLRSVKVQGSLVWEPVVKQQVLDAAELIRACTRATGCPTTIHWTTCVEYRGR